VKACVQYSKKAGIFQEAKKCNGIAGTVKIIRRFFTTSKLGSG
jgi:hypothetical protein